MTREEETILDQILNQLDNNTKNTLIKLLMTHDRKDVWLQAVPIYEDLRHQGHLLVRRVKGYNYAVGLKHEAVNYVDELKGDEPHIIDLN